MLITTLPLKEKYDLDSPLFKQAYAFLLRDDLHSLTEGSIPLENGVVAVVQEYITSPSTENPFETHEKNIDIQYMVSGTEYIEMTPRSVLEADGAYNPETDMTLYKNTTECSSILLKPGDFITITPEEAHKPRCIADHPQPVKKIVFKLPV